MTVKAWVLSASERIADGAVDLEVLIASTAYRLAPSAMLDYSRADNGYDSSDPYIAYTLPHQYSRGATAVDASHFAQGDYVRIIEADPADASNPQTWLLTVSSVDSANNAITLSGALTGWVSTKRYILQYDDYATLDSNNRTAQVAFTFLADDGDRQVQDLTAAMIWNSGAFDENAAAPVTSTGLMRPPDLCYSEGEPLSAHTVQALAAAVNNCKAHVCNQHPICLFPQSPPVVTDSDYDLVAGPLVVHAPPQATHLALYCWTTATGGAGTIRATAADELPGGDSSDPTFGLNVVTATRTTSASGTEELAMTLPLWENPDRTCWVTLEAKNDGGGSTAFRGVSGFFVEADLNDASPTFVASSSGGANGSAVDHETISVTVTVPTGAIAGDLIVAHVQTYFGQLTTYPQALLAHVTGSPPATHSAFGVTNYWGETSVLWGIYDGSTSYSFTMQRSAYAGNTMYLNVALSAWRNITMGVAASNYGVLDGNLPISVSLDVVGPNRQLIAIHGMTQLTAFGMNTPTSYTDIYEVADAQTTVSAWRRAQAPAGLNTVTFDDDGHRDAKHAAFVLALA